MNKRFEIIAIVLAVIGVFIALFAWLAPFSPIGNSPFDSEASPNINMPSTVPAETQPARPSENIFTQNFDSSDGSFDPNIFVCESASCNAENVFQRNGILVFKFNALEVSSEVWGVYMTSKVIWKMENLISIEGYLQISPNTTGGTWLGLNSSAACALFAKRNADNASVHCDLSSNGTTEYTTTDLPAKFDTWYLVRIDYDPVTHEQKYYLDNVLIGRHTPQDLPVTASLSLGAWREENQSVNAFMDNIVVRTKP